MRKSEREYDILTPVEGAVISDVAFAFAQYEQALTC